VSNLYRALVRADLVLRKLRLSWALVGGMAVSVRAEPRTTRDLDVSVAVGNDSEAESAVRELMSHGYRLQATPLEHLDTKRIATVRFLSTGAESHGVILDVLFASSGIENEVVAAATPIEVLAGLVVPVASVWHLLALKTLAGRHQDITDIKSLLRFADEADLHRAREALELISRRGFDRGKDLQAEFTRLIDQTTEEQ
jgi:hypothetical protein